MKRLRWLGLIAILAIVYSLWPGPEPARTRTPERAANVAPEPPLTPALSRALAPDLAPSPDVATSSIVLFGLVRDAEGHAIASATVRALPRRGGEALVSKSGAEGEYVLFGVPPALDALSAEATGYRTATVTPPGASARRARVDFTLVPSPGIRGIVRCAGEPVAGARVWARKKGAGPHGRGHRPFAMDKSGPDGRFLLELDAPPEGEVEVAAWSGLCGEGRVDYAGAPVAIELEGGATVSGRVVDAKTQRPVPSFWISASSLLHDAGGLPAVSVDDERGAFTLGPLSPGRQRLYVAAPGYRPESRELQLSAGETVADQVFALSRSLVLKGRVTDARTGQPIAGAEVAPAEWAAEVLSDAVEAVTDADGRFTLDALPGRRTSVTARAKGYRPLMHGGVDGRSTKAQRLDFALTPIGGTTGEANELVGIGAQLTLTEGGVEIAGLVPGGPAAERLREGDVIVQVDGTPVASLELGDVVQAIRGELGTDVVLWVRRAGSTEPTRVVLSRARVSFGP